MSESLILGAVPNYLALPGAQVTTGAAVTPIERLLDDDAGERFRWTTPASSSATWVRWDFGRTRRIGAVALPNHNLAEKAQIRLRLAVDAPLVADSDVRVPAVSVRRWGAAAGDAAGEVDGWAEADGMAYLFGPGDAWGALFSSIPTAVPSLAPRAQALRIRLRAIGGRGPVYPLHVQLMPSPAGSDPLAQFPAGEWIGAVTRDFDEERIVDLPWTWDTVQGGEPLGEMGVVVRVGTLPGAIVARGWELRAVEWVYVEASDPTATVTDTGWLDLDPGPVLDELRLADLVSVPTDWGWLALDGAMRLAPITCRYGLVEIRPGLTPEPSAEVGLLSAGPAFGLNLQTDVRIAAVDPTVVERSEVSSHEVVFPRRPYLTVRAALHQSAGSGTRDVLQLLGLGMGRRRPMLVAPVPASRSASALRIWGRLARSVEMNYHRAIRSDREVNDPDPWSWRTSLDFEQAL